MTDYKDVADFDGIRFKAGVKEIDTNIFAPISVPWALNYLGKDRTTTIDAAEELAIPAGSLVAIISCAPSTQAFIELNGDASVTSPLCFEYPYGPVILNLGLVTKLSAWCAAGNVGALFFG